MRRFSKFLGWLTVGLLSLGVVLASYLYASNYYGSRRDERSRKILYNYLLFSNVNFAKVVASIVSNKEVYLNYLYQDSIRNGYLGKKYSDFGFGVINYVGDTVTIHPRLGIVSAYINKVEGGGRSSIQLQKDGRILPVVISRFSSISLPNGKKYVFGSDKKFFSERLEGGSIGIFTLFFADQNYVLDIQLLQ